MNEKTMGLPVNIEVIKDTWEYMLQSFPEFAKYTVPFNKVDVFFISNKTMKKFENMENTIKGLALGRTYKRKHKITNEITYLILLNKVLNNNDDELLNTLFHELLHVIEYETNNAKITILFETLLGSSRIVEEKVNVNIANKLLNKGE